MPKLLIISVTCNQGSTGKIAEQIGLIMEDKGWDVYYAHGARRVNPSKLKTIPFSSVKAEYIHALKAFLCNADGLGSTKETEYLIKKIRDIQPDVIHIHNIHGYYLNYKLLFEYLNSTNIPIVVTLHDCWDFTGHCAHFESVKCLKWKSGCYDCPLIWFSNMSLIDRSRYNYELKKSLFTNNKNLLIVPVSNWLGDLVKQSFLKDKNIKVIHNGIDLTLFKPYPRHDLNKFQILGVSNVWDKSKGLPDIYRLRELLPIEDFEFVLVGLSEKQIKQLPLGIIGIRNTANQQELAKIYSDADVLINPTYADTYPTVNLESIACGTPVITYNTGGSSESLSEFTGIVVEQGCISSMYEAIKCIKNNTNKSKYSTEVCRKYAENNFDKNTCFRKYCELFSSVIKES